MGATHVRLAAVTEDVLHGALQVAWKLRVEKNGKSGKRATGSRSEAVKRKARKK
jgi:hypothetical protein